VIPQSNKAEQSDGYEKTTEDFPLATGDSQHRGRSVSAAGTSRNITDTRYGGVDPHPKVRGSRLGPRVGPEVGEDSRWARAWRI
jgi:hypothetical protein